jgi:endoglycosylceramidase
VIRPVIGPVVALALAVGALGPLATPASATGDHGASILLPLHVAHGKRTAVIDTLGRQVTLRGVNVNSLGDYHQADPNLPPVVPVTGADWDAMAAHGFNVVRLLVSWSRIEPRPGRIDRSYVEVVRRTVHDAARRGIYSVIDMHQDAWGKSIASPPGVVCPAGTNPAIGWDGAPAWATITDGAGTCTPGSREDSEAVRTAWDSFYADRDGIMSHLVAVWGVLGREFAREPAVAGFDLLNEPNHGHGSDYAARLGVFYARAIDAIRAGERAAGGFSHPAIIETTVYGAAVPFDFTTDRNVVFEGHNYGESIEGALPLEVLFDYFQGLATGYDAPLWIGEYGWFSDPPAQRPKLARYAAKEDQLLTAGDAWWQWRQACGDPHSIGHPGGTPDAIQIHFQRNACPGDRNLGVVAEWSCTWRGYPRAVPGRLRLRASVCDGPLVFMASTRRPARAEVWFPGGARPSVVGTNITGIERIPVPGGWSVRFTGTGTYSAFVGA